MSDNLIGATTAIFIVSLSIAVGEPVDVAWSTRDGTAKAGTDYQAASGVVSFLPGETQKQIEVTVYGQNVSPTGDKNFFINLMPPTNAVLGTTLIEAVIKVEDEAGVPVTSVIVAQGKRGLRGEPGLSAYEQAVLMGYEGTVEDWMQEQADAAAAAQRASDYAANAAAAAAKAENAATAASFLGNIFPTPEAGVDPVTGVGNGAYYNVRSTDDESYLVEYQNIGGVPTPSGKSYPSSAYVQNLSKQVKDVSGYVPLPFVPSKEYAVGERVTLSNGDIVKSTVPNNIIDPNVDMSGWILANEVSQIVLANGLSQSDKNKDFVFVEDYYAKGGALRPVSDLYTIGSSVYQKRFKSFADVQAFFPHVTAETDPLDWAATQKAVNENSYVRMRGVFYYWGDKVVEFPVNCLYFHGAGITTRIYTTGLKALKAKDGVRMVMGDYGHFYLVGNSTPNSIGFDTSAFSYCTFQNIWIRQYGDGWFADGSTSPVNKQYSNNTIINVRSNNNLDRGFKFVGSSEANSANTYIGCEGAGNFRGFDEQVGYSNQTVGCTFQGNTELDFYSDGERNIHEFYAEGKPKTIKLGALSKNNKVSVRSSYPLWNTFIDEGMDNNKSVRGELDVEQHIFRNTYFEDWSSSLPSGITLNGTPVAAFYADTNTQKGGGLQLTYNANFQGFIIQNLDPTVNYAKRWVTVQIEADTSGCTDLSAFRVYAREGANANGATGTFAVTALEKTAAGKYKNFTFDVRFPDVITGSPNIQVYLAYSGITTTNTIKIRAIKVVLGQTDRVGDCGLSQQARSAVSTAFSSATSGLNTAYKYAGKIVYNSTVGKVYYASGSSPLSPWKSFDGTPEIVPA